MIIPFIIAIITSLAAVIALVSNHRNSLRMQARIDELTSAGDALSRQNAALEATNQAMSEQQSRMESQSAQLAEQLQQAQSQHNDDTRTISSLQERLTMAQEAHAKMLEENEIRFRNIANQVLQANSRDLQEQSQLQLSQILSPLKENIEAFKKTVTDTYNNEARERFSLQERIRELIELNNTIGQEARQLSTALRGNNKIQGDWGEMILESILEKSGLTKGREFDVQVTTDNQGNTLRDDEGNCIRPDVVVYYPDGRCVVIDSKVSLSAYIDLVNCQDPEMAGALGRNHVTSVRRHIAELASKNYQDFVGDRHTDFVMMFIPNEGAYIQAMQLDSHLWQDAYDSRVLIVSPTHLISALRLVEQLWRQDRMRTNVEAIATEGGNMYDKLVGFIDDMQRIEKSINQTREAYDKAVNKLSAGRGSLVKRAEKMRKLGAKVSKSLPQEMLSDDSDLQLDTPE